ncbi:glycosyl transferase [Burkholderia diffusa]|uniref:Glycosyl transferase n=1 Tax=Burkholderia diffusa TaxID=488732 RepID=A0AAW3PIU3_9BURK|nr:glycosyltransferase [Burkholderia diffusa]KWF37299.1 glycosyl transferase [Burkholderia diffusa]KWF40464.1 glycosyl transferase [Burkholderia diffusa]KWF42656.1 glycosyl transferase [Burkholderia diffusa]KWF56206.1 glycosyl transferase [Burkholderia diffusa]
MKIVHIVESSATGTLSMVCLIANRLAREGHDVHVVYSVRPDTPPGLAAMFDTRVSLRHVQMKGAGLLRTVGRLRATLNEIGPDAVHLHSSFAGFLGRLSTLFALPKAAFFYSPHCISFMRRDISGVKRLAFVGLEWIACVRKCLYVACSESEGRAIRAWLRQPVVVVENAVSATLSSSQPGEPEGPPNRPPCVVTVGGIRAQKNPELFARIAHGMRARGTHFVWIGDGDDAAKARLAEAGVEVTGWLPRDEVARRLAHADMYLSTSSWEGMPVSVIEAMLAGRPVIVSGCAGNVDVVRHLQTGVIYATAADAVAWLERLASDDALRGELARRASHEARQRFGEDRLFDELAPLYAAWAAR